MEHVDLNDLIKVPVILSTKQCRIPRWEKETDPGPFFLPLFFSAVVSRAPALQ